MSGMDHAAAHERIEDLLLEPSRLAALETSREPADRALRDHVASCAVCRADLEGWQDLQHRLAVALPGSEGAALAAVEPIEVPPSLRASIVAGVHAEPRRVGNEVRIAQTPVSAVRARASRFAPLLALAASLIVIVGSTALVVDQSNRRATAQAETAALTEAVAAVGRILAEPKHVIVQLHTADGTSAGSISWSRHDWVVITTALAAPAAGQAYLCWLEQDGRSDLVGSMQFAGDTAYWVASVDRWATWEIGPTTKFIVTLQPVDGRQPIGPTLLEAALGA